MTLLKTDFFKIIILAIAIGLFCNSGLYAKKKDGTPEKKPLTFEDVMKFNSLRGAKISEDGHWAVYYTKPERGDSRAFIQSTDIDTMKYEVERGLWPVISSDGNWVVMTVAPNEIEAANKKGKDKPKNGMALVRTSDGKQYDFDDINSFKFSNNSHWLAYKSFNGSSKPNPKKKKLQTGSDIVLRHLESGSEITFQNATEFAFDSLSNHFTYIVSEPEGKKNGIYNINLNGSFLMPKMIIGDKDAHYTQLAWNHDKELLAFVASKEKDNGAPDSCSVLIWNAKANEFDSVATSFSAPKDWFVPFKNKLDWTIGGKRLYFGFKPYLDTLSDEEDEIKYDDSTYYDRATILKQTQLDVWHWDDPLIKPNRKVYWPRIKDRFFDAVYHLDSAEYVQLGDLTCPDIRRAENPNFVIGTDDTPYLKEITWAGWFRDLYVVNIRTGEKQLVQKRQEHSVSLAPTYGKHLVYFYNKHWHMYDCVNDSSWTLTDGSDGSSINEIPFYNEKWDTPANPADLGVAGWFKDDIGVIINGNYDLYKFYINGAWFNQTAGYGRETKYVFRVKNLDPERRFFKDNELLYLYAYSDLKKNRGIVFSQLSILGVSDTIVVNDPRYYSIVAKAKNAEKYIVVKQKYEEFPDLWVADSALKNMKQISEANPQMKDYLWGKAELIDWISDDGDSLQGYFIKPDNYDPSKKYPVIVYFYEKMTQRMHRFDQPGNHHRPCFPLYSGDGYVMFLPDVNFKDGRPGFASINSIVPGVKKLIEMGIADPEKVGLWGHSWSGYQAAFIITQTDFFACAVAGAPVGNMTSAYSGIRLGSGLARQFQYEKQQSRIGGNLWDSLDNYIDNSPIFHAPNVHTPLLIMFGDKDQAVPWEQGIELYLAMRRLNKNCIFLEYRGEPHWPRKYFNRLDYAIKMKEFYDHYLKGKPAPEWMTKGVEYKGK